MSRIKLIKKLFIVILIILSITVVRTFAFSVKVYQSDDLELYENILDETLLASNQFTQADDLTVVDNFLDIPESYLLVGENQHYKLYMEEESYAIRVLNKVDGFIYGSSISTKDDNLNNFNTTWEGIVNSCVTINYYSYDESNGVYITKEESIFRSEDSTTSYTLIENGFRAHLYYGESKISLDIIVYLDGEYLRVEVPNESINEEDYKLRSIKIYPFLGAVYSNDITGYILVPDGSGALVRYKEIDAVTEIYQFNYYGQDNSIRNELENEPIMSLPVSGMIHGINQHGFISIIENGASEASLVVSPAKRNLKYNYSYNEFTYRALYQTPLSESDLQNASGRLVIEDEINSCNPVIKYKFLSGDSANYVGMANSYQDYLLNNNLLIDHVDSADDISVFLDIIAAETKSGFIFDEYIKLTDVEELISILTELDTLSIDPLVVYKGYNDLGLTSSGLDYDSLNRKLGSLKSLLDFITQNQFDLYFHIDPMISYSDADFSIYNDVSKRINDNLNEYQGFTKNYYYMKPTSVIESITNSVIFLEKSSINNVLIDSIGSLLYSDYSDNTIDRSMMIDILIEKLSTLENNIMLYQANDYLLKYTNSYLLTPMSSSRYRIYTDTVPFTAYVLSGVLDKYSTYMNFSSTSKIELLKLVDYGVSPSYLITNESAYALQNTELKQIYSSSFDTWKERINNDYQFVYEGLLSINNAKVVSRTFIQTGVYLVKYDNQVDIYINYTNDEIDLGDIIIDPLNYKVVTNS
ncbi:DUF5696 domain-containing protein [Candidatus Izemoplasma sp. B36]|uniref:DUF5696 domain-containing protein n=1 Tax=Candidatus Izemoplasma sp. B36 TaxID=3242468 RepID=UPI003556BC92